MNLDELTHAIRAVSPDLVVQKLAYLLLDWKTETSTAEDLRDRVERYLGNSWVGVDEDYNKIYRLWSAFRDEAIAGIGGMTMNERLYWFSLFERFDASHDEEERLIIYRKLHGTR